MFASRNCTRDNICTVETSFSIAAKNQRFLSNSNEDSEEIWVVASSSVLHVSFSSCTQSVFLCLRFGWPKTLGIKNANFVQVWALEFIMNSVKCYVSEKSGVFCFTTRKHSGRTADSVRVVFREQSRPLYCKPLKFDSNLSEVWLIKLQIKPQIKPRSLIHQTSDLHSPRVCFV